MNLRKASFRAIRTFGQTLVGAYGAGEIVIDADLPTRILAAFLAATFAAVGAFAMNLEG